MNRADKTAGYSATPLARKLGITGVRHLGVLRRKLRADAAVWVSWPKKAVKIATNVTEDTIREAALPLRFVDIKVCAVTELWSGLKLVVRRELR